MTAAQRNPKIWIANADGTGTPRNLTQNPALDATPAW